MRDERVQNLMASGQVGVLGTGYHGVLPTLPCVMSDQSDIMIISDQETASSVTWDDVSRPLTPHPAQPIISAGK